MATVLIVEDESITVLDLKRLLKERGHEVAGTTKRGEDVIDLVRRLAPEVIVMDIHLAGAMDGIEAAGLVRREFSTPFLFLTADAIDEVNARTIGLEPCAAVIKPFPADDFESAVDRLAGLNS